MAKIAKPTDDLILPDGCRRPFDSRRHLSQRRRQACCCTPYYYYPPVCFGQPQSFHVQVASCHDNPAYNATYVVQYEAAKVGVASCFLGPSGFYHFKCVWTYYFPTPSTDYVRLGMFSDYPFGAVTSGAWGICIPGCASIFTSAIATFTSGNNYTIPDISWTWDTAYNNCCTTVHGINPVVTVWP